MKILIGLFLCITALALTQTNAPVGFVAGNGLTIRSNMGVIVISNALPLTAQNHIDRLREAGMLTNVINQLVADGSFCHVRGHKWEFGAGLGAVTLLYESNPKPSRNCAVCGLVQTQEVGPWK